MGIYLDEAFGVHARRAFVAAALIRATLGREVILGGGCAPISANALSEEEGQG